MTLQLALIAVIFVCFPPNAFSQSSLKRSASDSNASARRGLQLADTGHCREALPLLHAALPHIADRATKYKAAIAITQCAMSLHQVADALEDLGRLNRDFPNDPQVLYITAHFGAELASDASLELAHKDPTSYQAQELDAESYEAHGKWSDAIAEYKRILQQYPNLRSIHYRIGRVILSMPSTPTTAQDAKQEFEEELKVDPTNAAAEFMLGDVDRQLQDWNEAIAHFTRASRLDVGFLEAYLGLGMALNAEGHYADAVAPLEKYVSGVPDDAAGHYQLAMAYARTGRRDAAERELARQRELNATINKDNSSPEVKPQDPPQ
ncbi:MAG TPA: tetratricopeptide repeat protein [Candidatus Acidoferrales bacterium]|nr:tetratricopeptide repeat protein [Candidatus Acidoferrales bacterium]